MSTDHPPGQHARLALAAYLRLLAACLQDEAELIESGGDRGDDVLRRFRDGVLALSLENAPLDALIAGGIPEPAVAVRGRSADPAGAKRRR